MVKTVRYETNQFSVSAVSISKTVPFLTIQFCQNSISKNSVLYKYAVSSIQPIDRTLSGATTLGQSGLGSNDNEGVFLIPQSSSLTGTAPSDCLVSYPGYLLSGGLIPLQRCSWCILRYQFQVNRSFLQYLGLGNLYYLKYIFKRKSWK